MEILKFTNRAKNFYPYSKRINGSILKYVPIDATKKSDKKTSKMVGFIVYITHPKAPSIKNHLRI